MGLRQVKKNDLVAKDEVEKMSIVQEIMLKSMDYLRRNIAPVGGQGGVAMSYLCPNCNSFRLEDYVWWVTAGKTTKCWCAICGEKLTGGAFGRAKRRKRGAGEGLQSECDTAGLVRKFDQCIDVVGESARRWRRSPTEHCDKPRLRKQERCHGRPARPHHGA